MDGLNLTYFHINIPLSINRKDDDNAMNKISELNSFEKSSPIDSASRVLIQESEAIKRMSKELGQTFISAIEIFEKINGRIIVSGMGKSGHIGKKIAATLASTGSPAIFVHPAEASHGDLGMITSQDALLILSNSGETHELNDLIEYAKRFEIPLVAIVGCKISTLTESSNVSLILPDEPEAGTLGLAPTTSTTMALAMGDAIAVSLFERRGFSDRDFQVFHPGGKLGKQLLRVSDIMHVGKNIPVVKLNTPMSEALLVITEKSFGCVGVISESELLVGVITDGDLRRHMQEKLLSMYARDVMTDNPRTIRPNALAAEALGIMNELKITSLFVSDSDNLKGIIHIHDCLRAGVA
tara:strand:- start:3348 stop:4409 length:1062 start_codon:yes stop_codon:yes gene_type:complete